MSESGAERSMEADLVAWGKAIGLEAIGRRSGRPRRVTIGFVEEDGCLLVAAATAGTHWARNLEADPRCRVELRGRLRAYRAVRLPETDRDAAVAALILKYGAPAERLGGGLAFRLEPA
jgi:deazaflavin-dependent oxidoreductase (nitroreductase family)